MLTIALLGTALLGVASTSSAALCTGSNEDAVNACVVLYWTDEIRTVRYYQYDSDQDNTEICIVAEQCVEVPAQIPVTSAETTVEYREYTPDAWVNTSLEQLCQPDYVPCDPTLDPDEIRDRINDLIYVGDSNGDGIADGFVIQTQDGYLFLPFVPS